MARIPLLNHYDIDTYMILATDTIQREIIEITENINDGISSIFLVERLQRFKVIVKRRTDTNDQGIWYAPGSFDFNTQREQLSITILWLVKMLHL